MKRLFLITIVLFSLFFEINAQPGFLKKYGPTVGSSMYSWERNVVLIPVDDGNYCIATFRSSDSIDITLIKINPVGDTLWTKTYRRNNPEFVFDGQQTSDGGFILAGAVEDTTTSDGLLIKTNSSGNILWSKKYGNPNFDWFYSVHQTPDGGFIAAGSTYFSNNSSDMYLLKTDANGNIVWTKKLGSNYLDWINSMQCTSDNGFILAGSTFGFGANTDRIYLVKTDATGTPEWSKIYGGTLGEYALYVQQCADNGFIITGTTNSFSASGSSDIFLLKTDSSGNFQWMKTYGSGFKDKGHHVLQTSDGGYLVTGQVPTATPIYYLTLIKTDQAGDTLWTRFVNNGRSSIGFSSFQTPDGGYMIATNPDSLKIYKTDSLGHTSCVENNLNLTIISATPTSSSGVFTSSGGATAYINFSLTYTPFITEDICFLTGIEDIEVDDSQIQLFPNPFNDQLMISVDGNREYEIKIYNMLSQEILTEKFSVSTIVNTSNFSKGMYLYLLSNNGRLVKKGKLLK